MMRKILEIICSAERPSAARPDTALLAVLRRHSSCFAPELYDEVKKSLDYGNLWSQWPGAPTRLPIEWFKELPTAHMQTGLAAPVRTFLSSGTTSASRSRSPFSPTGLACYRLASLVTFLEVLTRASGREPGDLTGISLVPPSTEWPDSSLAAMVTWISEILPVRFGSRALEQHNAHGKPVWIIGTAFHFVNLADAGLRITLPADSVIIETGGTKGQSRSVTRSELYRLITGMFGVPEHRILSEYGMCEMASQGWDWVEHGDTTPLDRRCLRFPGWVRPALRCGWEDSGDPATQCDTGALVIDDAMRVDFPLPLRTMDIFSRDRGMARAGSLRFVERYRGAPLKGCSLNVDDNAGGSEPEHARSLHLPPAPLPQSTSQPADARLLPALLTGFLGDPETLRLMTSELGSPRAARDALADIRKSLPADPSAWLSPAEQPVTGATRQMPWLIIAPENHSLAAFESVTVALAAGLKVCLRIPARFQNHSNVLMTFAVTLQRAGFPISTVGPEFRISSQAAENRAFNVVAIGSDETIARLAGGTQGRFVGQGTLSGITCAEAPLQGDAAALIARDCLALGQKGCLSARLVILRRSRQDAALAPLSAPGMLLQEACAGYWGADLTLDQRLGQELEHARYLRLGWSILAPRGPAQPLVAFRDHDSVSQVTTDVLRDSFANQAHVIPVLTIGDTGNAASFVNGLFLLLKKSGLRGTISMPHPWPAGNSPSKLVESTDQLFRVTDSGSANVRPWNLRPDWLFSRGDT